MNRSAALLVLALIGGCRPSPTALFDCEALCISDATVTAGQGVTITFAPPKEHIWGVDAELRPLEKEPIAWLYASSGDERLRTVWPRRNLAFPSIGFGGRATWTWTIPNKLEPGIYEIRKESVRHGSTPVEERIETWAVSFEVTT